MKVAHIAGTNIKLIGLIRFASADPFSYTYMYVICRKKAATVCCFEFCSLF